MRISFAGGGTDLEAYYREHVGLVISTSIDKYFYVFANLNGSESVQITSSDYRTFFRQRRGEPILWDGDLTLPRAFLHQFGIDAGMLMLYVRQSSSLKGVVSFDAIHITDLFEERCVVDG